MIEPPHWTRGQSKAQRGTPLAHGRPQVNISYLPAYVCESSDISKKGLGT